MTAGGLDVIHIAAAALIFLFLTARKVKKPRGSFFRFFRMRNNPVIDGACGGFFKKPRIPSFKKCPNCDEPVPLATVLCHACDYNFLAARPGRGQKLLPPPQPMADEVSEKIIASVGL